MMPRTENAQFYQLYFQEPGVAEAELERDPRTTVRNMLYGASGEVRAAMRPPRRAAEPRQTRHGAEGRRLPARRRRPARLPAWLNEADIDFYAADSSAPAFAAAELLSQHRPQLGTDGGVRGRR